MGTLQLPGSTGGPNWQGGSLDPESNIVYIYSKDEATALSMVRGAKRSNMDWINGAGGEGGRRLAIDNLPILRPPWGTISAIDLNKGEILWQTVHGETDDAVTNHAALKGVKIPRTGRPGRVGVLTTKSLVMAGDSGMATHPNGQRSGMFRAYDKQTGKELGAVPHARSADRLADDLPARGQAVHRGGGGGAGGGRTSSSAWRCRTRRSSACSPRAAVASRPRRSRLPRTMGNADGGPHRQSAVCAAQRPTHRHRAASAARRAEVGVRDCATSTTCGSRPSRRRRDHEAGASRDHAGRVDGVRRRSSAPKWRRQRRATRSTSSRHCLARATCRSGATAKTRRAATARCWRPARCARGDDR